MCFLCSSCLYVKVSCNCIFLLFNHLYVHLFATFLIRYSDKCFMTTNKIGRTYDEASYKKPSKMQLGIFQYRPFWLYVYTFCAAKFDIQQLTQFDQRHRNRVICCNIDKMSNILFTILAVLPLSIVAVKHLVISSPATLISNCN